MISREMEIKTLERAGRMGHNNTQAAKLAGISRWYYLKRCRELDVLTVTQKQQLRDAEDLTER